MMLFSNLDWDSQFFKLKIGKIQVANFESIAFETLLNAKREEQYQLVYVFSEQAIAPLTEYLIDTKITYTCPVFDTNHYQLPPQLSLLPANTPLNDTLLSLALQSGEYSRFRLDNKMPTDGFLNLYTIWINDSLNGKIADGVLVYKEADTILGMVTFKHAETATKIGLIAVDSSTRGKSIGTHLLNGVKREAINHAKLSVDVPTQLENQMACHFYEKNQFDIKSTDYIYHIWL